MKNKQTDHYQKSLCGNKRDETSSKYILRSMFFAIKGAKLKAFKEKNQSLLLFIHQKKYFTYYLLEFSAKFFMAMWQFVKCSEWHSLDYKSLIERISIVSSNDIDSQTQNSPLGINHLGVYNGIKAFLKSQDNLRQFLYSKVLSSLLDLAKGQ